ncbi:hypothetical protein EC07798_4495 [Escherichia coli 07798]|nr:hypothetical protein EC07798_4495 [Escherichia coli 07798]
MADSCLFVQVKLSCSGDGMMLAKMQRAKDELRGREQHSY